MSRSAFITARKHGSKQPEVILISADEGQPDIAAVKKFYTDEFGSADTHAEYASVELHSVDASDRLRRNLFAKPKPVTSAAKGASKAEDQPLDPKASPPLRPADGKGQGDANTTVKPTPKANEKSK